MNERPVGYKNPPVETRWQRGVSGNPTGRPKGKPIPLSEMIIAFFNTTMQYREHGRMRTATRQELLFKKAIEEAVKGNIQAAELILKFRMSAHRFGNIGGNYLEIIDWLPDYGGQTAEQKTQGFASKTDGNAVEWWVKPGDDFTNE